MNDIQENLQAQPLLPPLMETIANITVENLRAIAVVLIITLKGPLRHHHNGTTLSSL
jgi:hypothetical protein